MDQFNRIPVYTCLITSYTSLNQFKKAKTIANKILKIDPNFLVETFINMLPYKHQEKKDEIIDILRKVGLPG